MLKFDTIAFFSFTFSHLFFHPLFWCESPSFYPYFIDFSPSKPCISNIYIYFSAFSFSLVTIPGHCTFFYLNDVVLQHFFSTLPANVPTPLYPISNHHHTTHHQKKYYFISSFLPYFHFLTFFLSFYFYYFFYTFFSCMDLPMENQLSTLFLFQCCYQYYYKLRYLFTTT